MKWVDRIPDRLISSIMGIGFAGLVIAIVVAIVDRPYRPENYVGGLDPVRIGITAQILSGAVLFTYLSLAIVAAWRETKDRPDLGYLSLMIGLAVMSASLSVLFIWMPSVSTPISIPVPIGIGMFGGFSLAVAGVLPSALVGWAAAVRRRDRGFLLALLVIALVVIVGFIRRR